MPQLADGMGAIEVPADRYWGAGTAFPAPLLDYRGINPGDRYLEKAAAAIKPVGNLLVEKAGN